MRKRFNGGFEEVWGSPVWVEAEHDVDVTEAEDMGSGETYVDADDYYDDDDYLESDGDGEI